MLEYKQVIVSLPQSGLSAPLSLVAHAGELSCVVAQGALGQSQLLKAAMGLWPVHSGFITMEGEPVEVEAATYFRQFTSFVPAELPHFIGSTAQMVAQLHQLRAHRSSKVDQNDWQVMWEQLNVPSNVEQLLWQTLPPSTQWKVLLGAVTLLHRPILLVDCPPFLSPTDLTLAAHCMDNAAKAGAAVVCASPISLTEAAQVVPLSVPQEANGTSETTSPTISSTTNTI